MTDPTDPGPVPDPTEAGTSPAERAAEPPRGPGFHLRQARQRRGYELKQVARELRLTTERVMALEDDNYEALPDPVFVVGYIRTYARLLDLDPEALAAAYRGFQAPRSARSVTPPAPPATASTQLGRHESHWLAIAAVLLVILLALAWWLQRRSEETALTLSNLARPLPEQGTLTSVASGSPADSDLESIPEEGEMPEALDEPEPPTDTETAASPLPQPEADLAQGVEKLDVVISFTGPTSVDVRDSTMNYALVGEMDQGDRHLLGGKPPYSLIIGNAAVTQIQVGGQPFDFQSVVKGNVARFILDPAPKASIP